MEEVDMSIPPSSLKRLRAWFGCSLIKTEEQFMKNGWENWNIKMYGTEGVTQNTKDLLKNKPDNV